MDTRAELDISRGEAAESQIDAFIERRARKGETDPDEREDLWVESVRRYNEQRRQQHRAAWCEYHRAAAERAKRTLEALIAEHEEAAEMLESDEGEGGR